MSAKASPTGWAALLLLTGFAQGAVAQPADLPIPAAHSLQFPSGIHVGKVGGQAYYLDAQGRILYGMDMRVLLRAGPDPALYCREDCTRVWQPVLAPAGSKPNILFPHGYEGRNLPKPPPGFYGTPQDAPDWTIIAGPQGPQWVYHGWHMVFVRRSDAHSDRYDGADDHIWNTLKFVAPPPPLLAPPDVQPIAVGGDYVLADGKGRRLYTGICRKGCGDWQPYRAGMAAAAVGEWHAATAGDFAQWTYRGEPVFVASEDNPDVVPETAKVLRP